MDFYSRKNLWKFFLLVCAVLIGVVTLLYTEGFLQDLRQEEIKKVNQWASAMHEVQRADEKTNITLATQIIQDNTTIPVILVDAEDNILVTKNLDLPRQKREEFLQERLAEMKTSGDSIELSVMEGGYIKVYYETSLLLQQLRLYPVILLVVIGLFVFIAYFAFSGARKAEQNQVWNGLAKETAHQIGTPLSSLMGWVELLRLQNIDPQVVLEMEKDVKRLETITNRFSKIGSQPALKETDILISTRKAVDYLRTRSPKKITVECHLPYEPIQVMLNQPLFEWVIENLIRNAIDAISGEGRIDVFVDTADQWVQIDVKDTGKGIPTNMLKTIFRPGYSTKKRGWGLGLSLARRIIEQYHQGKIFVAETVPDGGTTFRIMLPQIKAQ